MENKDRITEKKDEVKVKNVGKRPLTPEEKKRKKVFAIIYAVIVITLIIVFAIS